MTQVPVAMRKRPRQARSQVTVDAVLEAASQILASPGEEGVTTAAVANRAGVSIGTVYQYFPNRDAILLELARRDRNTIAHLMSSSEIGDEGLRAFVRDIIRIYRRRIGARRQFALMSDMDNDAADVGSTPKLATVVTAIWAARGLAGDPARDGVRATVLVRAVAGVLRTAAMQGVGMLDDPRLEDDLMDLIRSLFRHRRSADRSSSEE